MLFPLEHFQVNWVDGMKISKDHFIDSNQYVTDVVRDAQSTHLISSNYGLLPSQNTLKNTFDLQFLIRGENSITINLNSCNAITIGGQKIAITPTREEHLKITKELKGTLDQLTNTTEVNWYDIILIANPYQRIPIGTPSLDEDPPRHPYSDINYTLQVIPSNQVNISELGPYHFIVGKIKNQGGHLSIKEKYIPACTSIQSHPELILFYTKCVSYIQKIQHISFSIIRKINEKNKPSSIAKNFMYICQNTLTYIASIYYTLTNEMHEQSPIKIIGCISTLASQQYVSQQCIPQEDREELLKYIFEWTELTPKESDQILIDTGSVHYNHTDIYASIEKIERYLKMSELIWDKMNSLDFIGQRKENIVVTKQIIQPKEEQPKNKWSILD